MKYKNILLVIISGTLSSIVVMIISALYLSQINDFISIVLSIVLLGLIYFTTYTFLSLFVVFALKITGLFAYGIGAFIYRKSQYRIAFFFLNIACDNEVIDGCTILAYMYDFGEGVDQDYIKARELYKKSCMADDSIGCNNLASLYENGLGVEKNRSVAIKYYSMACNLGYETGCKNLSRINQ